MAAFVLDSNTQAVLIQYMDDTYPKTMAQARPFFDRITKKDESGKSVVVPLNLNYGGGTGSDFEVSLANAQLGGALHAQYVVLPAVVYGQTVLDNAQARFTQGAESAIDALTDATKGCMEVAAQNLESCFFGTGYGNMATIVANSNPSGSNYLLTLSSLSEAIKFNPGNVIVSAVSTATALDAGTAKVIGMNQLGSQILVLASGGWTPANTHVIGLQGQLLGSSTLSGPAGIFAFCPPIESRTAGALNDNFLGCDRSIGGVSTGGWALDGKGKPITEGINTLASMMANFATAKPDSGYANPIVVGKVASELKTQARYDMKSVSEADVFYTGITVHTGAGDIDLMSEAACPEKYVVITKASTWVFGSPGNRPMGPSSLEGKLATPAYDHNLTRFTIMAAGFFYTTAPQGTGVLSIA